MFMPWIFHWKDLSSLYRNYRKSIQGPKGEWDISCLPVFKSDFLKRGGFSISILHKQKTSLFGGVWLCLNNWTPVFVFYIDSCELYTGKETFLAILELLSLGFLVHICWFGSEKRAYIAFFLSKGQETPTHVYVHTPVTEGLLERKEP